MILSFWWARPTNGFSTQDLQPGHLCPAVVLTPGPKFFSYWPSHLLITIHVLHGFFSISKRSITADTSVPREWPLPITRYPHDRMPNYIAYSNSAKGDSAKYSRIRPRVLGQMLLYSAKETRPSVLVFSQGYSAKCYGIRPRGLGQVFSYSAKGTRPSVTVFGLLGVGQRSLGHSIPIRSW